ncbi:MAG: tetratricopeptide repeat protein [Prevotellaceae bacterium]|jgi:outer membrane protein assembly factor BamD (BamD/ComL family)|nr:tetratricopeptide repeat protein [Prevotellaceae bacterium]
MTCPLSGGSGALLAAALLLCAAGCSTKKNTWASRAYHNVTSEFNVKFNGNESFREGVRKADRYTPDEYEQIPPVFAYAHREIPGKVSGEMDRTIEKCEKLILKHSITAKPAKKPDSKASRTERDFYNRKEFNSVVDDACLLSGKANLYLHEYDKAILIFDHLLTEYPKSSSAPEARLHLAAALILTDNPERAETLLDAAAKDKKTLSKRLTALLNATYAELYIRQKKYGEAAARLNSALQRETKKANKIRYCFILAELFSRVNRNDEAMTYLNRITQLNPPYNVVFSAQMRKAALYNPRTQGSKLKEELRNMLGDEKNREYSDQIYFALAQVEQLSGNDSLAMDYLGKSIAAESSNEYRKALSYMMLARHANAAKQFPEAYAAYMNALTRLSPDYPQYDSLEKTAGGLRRLAENTRIIQREDSLQRIAAMPAAEREQWIAGIIAKITEEEEQQRQQQRQQQYFMYQEEYSRSMDPQTKSNSWYFYNVSSVNSGLSSFNMRWGKRRLEDNWRRRNKQETSFAGQTENKNTAAGEQQLSNKSPEYYTRDLPLTPEAMAASDERLSNALFRLGEAYRDDVHEPLPAIAAFRTLDGRFPQNDNRASVYYYLYNLYTETDKPDSAGYYKQLLIANYPKTPLAQQLTNPNYFAEQQAEKAAMDAQYEKIFETYNAQQYVEAGNMAQQMIDRFPNSLLQPQLEFIRAVSAGAGGNIAAYKSALTAIVQQYPASDIAKTAAETIALLEKQELQYTPPDREPAAGTAIAPAAPAVETPYLFSTTEHYAGFICEPSKDTAALLFALESYNADAHIEKNLEVTIYKIGENYVITIIRAFPTLTEAKNYADALGNNAALEHFPPREYRKVLITPENLDLLMQSKDIAAYLNFFTKNYLQP